MQVIFVSTFQVSSGSAQQVKSVSKSPKQQYVQIVDLSKPFADLCTNSNAPCSTALLSDVIEPNRQIYELVLPKSKLLEPHITKCMTHMAGKGDAVKQITKKIKGESVRQISKFEKYFGALSKPITVYMLPSLMTFNGKVSVLDSEPILFLGIDELALKATDIRVLIVHEAFHIYHMRTAPDLFIEVLADAQGNPPLFLNFWLEGLAVLVSKKLCHESLGIVLYDKSLAGTSREDVAKAAEVALGKLDSTNDIDFNAFFRSTGKENTSRIGYLLGYRIALSAAKKLSLRELALLGRSEVRDIVETELKKLMKRANHRFDQ